MTTTAIRDTRTVTEVQDEAIATTGPAAAAMISGGVGTLVIGLMTTGAVISEGLKEVLNWWNPAGPLSGKTSVGVIAWLISWFLLHTIWKGKESDLNKAFIVTLVLVGLGLILTFPPVFEAFE
ncbi:MAG: hypothetical protein L0332_19645 [Chloroflexi bacterium]|nr:hypothetical protein [Chloroflexota bacterium]MCI0579821.1 hypothetical protein [Chloroflexota bacterium]MCI0646747.1 hypothetical protein [Chloroflexota bacterium]MCI0728911.1 hypothetical protein [Chloroflexota bacterium]